MTSVEVCPDTITTEKTRFYSLIWKFKKFIDKHNNPALYTRREQNEEYEIRD